MEKGLQHIEFEDFEIFAYNEKEVAREIKVATDQYYEKKLLTKDQYKAITETRTW